MEKDLHTKINAKKTKVFVCSRDNNIKTKIKLKDDIIVEQVEDFIYLGKHSHIGNTIFIFDNITYITI